MHYAGAPAPVPQRFRDLFKRTLIHEDVVSYASGLRGKVTAVISAALQVLDSAYQRFKDFPVNTGALAELEGSAEAYAFEHFNA